MESWLEMQKVFNKYQLPGREGAERRIKTICHNESKDNLIKRNSMGKIQGNRRA